VWFLFCVSLGRQHGIVDGLEPVVVVSVQSPWEWLSEGLVVVVESSRVVVTNLVVRVWGCEGTGETAWSCGRSFHTTCTQ